MPAPPASQGRPKLLQQVRHALRVHHYSRRTEEAYVGWVRRYVRFHGLRHPMDPGEQEIREFLTALAVRGQVSASTQRQALSALLFLYREVLRWDRVSSGILEHLDGIPRVVCILLYGSGLRLLEALELRVKDLDFAGGEIRVRRAKGAKDRVTVLPGALSAELRRHLDRVRRLHQRWQYVFPAARRHLHPSGDYRRHHVP